MVFVHYSPRVLRKITDDDDDYDDDNNNNYNNKLYGVHITILKVMSINIYVTMKREYFWKGPNFCFLAKLENKKQNMF